MLHSEGPDVMGPKSWVNGGPEPTMEPRSWVGIGSVLNRESAVDSGSLASPASPVEPGSLWLCLKTP